MSRAQSKSAQFLDPLFIVTSKPSGNEGKGVEVASIPPVPGRAVFATLVWKTF